MVVLIPLLSLKRLVPLLIATICTRAAACCLSVPHIASFGEPGWMQGQEYFGKEAEGKRACVECMGNRARRTGRQRHASAVAVKRDSA